VFWAGGLALAAMALSKPCFFATLGQDGLHLVTRYPFKRVTAFVPLPLLDPPEVVDDTDSDGDPYYRARLVLPDSGRFDLVEGHHRPDCERVCEDFRATLEALRRP
jgi:hypothetical protein